MKQLVIIILIFATMTQCTSAKQNTVIATYEKKMSIPDAVKDIPDPNIRQLAINQLQDRTCIFTMVFNGNEYGFASSQPAIKDKFLVAGDNSIFIDMKTMKVSSQKTILDKVYVVEDTYSIDQWDIYPKETEIVEGKKCVKAILKNDPGTIAWYCPELPCQMGPNGIGGLPGLIIILETPSVNYRLKTLNTSASHSVRLLSEQKGTIVTEQQFLKIRESKLKDLGVGGSGVHIIRM